MKLKDLSTTVISLNFMIVVLLLVIMLEWENFRVNVIVFLTLSRGIISQNCFWWSINDMLPDTTGAEIFQVFKRQGRFVKLNIIGQEIYLVTQLNDIKQLLDLSPNPFGPGSFKDNFFASFIPKNVGISVNPDWKYRREYNDKVLETDKPHQMNHIFNTYIDEAFQTWKPSNFEEFTEFTRKLTSRIIFGTYEYNPVIYKVFKQADSLISARFRVNTVNSEDLKAYRDYLRYEVENPKPNTLLYLGNKYHKMLPIEDVIDQIPHWVFPIAGLFSVHLPRLLVLLANHPHELITVQEEIRQQKHLQKENYIRKCILELFRLNNAVNSTFRGLTEPFQFENYERVFEPGTQLVFFNNSVLRDLFDSPNQFIPSRWNTELEQSYRALMFNQANQKCPGKELVISLLTSGLVSFLEVNKNKIITNKQIDPNFVPYLINPCTLRFNTD